MDIYICIGCLVYEGVGLGVRYLEYLLGYSVERKISRISGNGK